MSTAGVCAVEHEVSQDGPGLCLLLVCVLQSVEAVCRGVVEQAAAAAETAQKDCAAWRAKYEAALDRCNQAEFKVPLRKPL